MKRVLCAVFLAAIFLPVVAAQANDVYIIPSEVEKYDDGATSNCQALDLECTDEEYSTTDIFTLMRDGSTTTGIGLRNASNSQSGYMRVVYDVSGLIPGEYKLRIAHGTGSGSYVAKICTYINHTAINTSSCLDFNHTAGDVWTEFNVDELVRESADIFDGRIILRYYVTDTSETLTEAYLKRPFRADDFSIIPTGVAQTEINKRVENQWAVVSVGELPDITNFTCTWQQLLDASEGSDHVLINDSQLDVQYSIGQGPTANQDFVSVYWDANETVTGIEEGSNYELTCNLVIGEVELDELSQFVYINNQRSIIDNIAAFAVQIMEILGFLDSAQQGGEAEITVFQEKEYLGGNGQIVARATMDGRPITNTTCFASLRSPNFTSVFANATMTNEGDGYQRYNYSVPYDKGTYYADTYCFGGNFTQRVFGANSIDVVNGVSMRSIT